MLRCHVSEGSSWLTVSQIFLPFPFIFFIWYPGEFWGVLARYFVECSQMGICLMPFSWLEQDNVFGEEDHGGKVTFSSIHIEGTKYQCISSALMLTLTTWLRVVFVRFLPWGTYSFDSLPSCLLWKKVTMCSPYLRTGKCSPLPESWMST